MEQIILAAVQTADVALLQSLTLTSEEVQEGLRGYGYVHSSMRRNRIFQSIAAKKRHTGPAIKDELSEFLCVAI